MAIPRELGQSNNSDLSTGQALLVLYFPFLLTLCVIFILIPGPHNRACILGGWSPVYTDWRKVSEVSDRDCSSQEVRNVIPYAIKGLHHKRDSQMRSHSAFLLGRCKIKRAVLPLAKALRRDPSDHVKHKLVDALQRMGPLAAPAIPELLHQIQSYPMRYKPYHYRYECIKTLRRIGPAAIPAFAKLLHTSGNRMVLYRQLAILFEEHPNARKKSKPIYYALGKLLKTLPEGSGRTQAIRWRRDLGWYLRADGLLPRQNDTSAKSPNNTVLR